MILSISGEAGATFSYPPPDTGELENYKNYQMKSLSASVYVNIESIDFEIIRF